MIMPSIDWNELWKQIQSDRSNPTHDPEFWDKRAPAFSEHTSKSDYIRQFISIMEPDPGWSVLDIGCAAGTLAVPLASLVDSVTALDPSEAMLSILDERCRQQGITNIRSVKGRWEDEWDVLDIGLHDVAIASRSLLINDLRWAILKLESHASKRVYLSTLVDNGPHERRIIEAVGRKFEERADYIVVYNLLRQMGRYANVQFTVNREDKLFKDIDDAVNSIRWMLHDMTQEEDVRLRSYLEKNLLQDSEGLKLPYKRVVRWAVLWWEKEHDATSEVKVK